MTASATGVFWAGGDLKRFLEDFAFHRLLAQQALQFLDLVLKGSIFGCRNDVFLRCGCGERSLRCKLAPIEQLVRLDAVTPRDDADRRIPFIRLLNDGELSRPSTSDGGAQGRTALLSSGCDYS